MKNKLMILCFSFSSIAIVNKANADMSYGAKFLATTFSGCAVGGFGSYFYADNTGYDSQPKAIVTWMGAATGCLTGAIFSYFFYDDNSATLNTRINEQQKTIADLSIQLADIQGQKQNGTFNPPKVAGNYPNPFGDFKVSEGVAKTSYDENKLPTGLNIKKCNQMLKFTLQTPDEIKLNSENMPVVAVSPHFALVGLTFLYSKNDCLFPSKNGVYAEEYLNGLTDFLTSRVTDWKTKHEAAN